RAIGQRPRSGERKRRKRRQPAGGDSHTAALCKLPPARADVGADARDLLPRAAALHNLKRLKCRGRPDALGPESAADEGALRGLHDRAPADDRGYGVAVAERLTEDRHVGVDVVEVVQPAESLAKTGGALVEDQDDATVRR